MEVGMFSGRLALEWDKAKGFMMMNTEGQIMANSRGEVVTDMSNVDRGTSIPLKWIMYRWAVPAQTTAALGVTFQ